MLQDKRWTDIKDAVIEQISDYDLKWIGIKPKRTLFDVRTSKLSAEPQIRDVKPTVMKWRSAEQQVVQIEEFFGNKAIDVSKQNLGYDIESMTKRRWKKIYRSQAIR